MLVMKLMKYGSRKKGMGVSISVKKEEEDVEEEDGGRKRRRMRKKRRNMARKR